MEEPFYSYDEVKQLYPYKLPFFDDSLICKKKEVFDKYNTCDETNRISINDSNTSFVNRKLIVDMIENKTMWRYFYSLCDKEVNFACDIIYIENNVESHIRLTKSEFAYAIKQIIPDVNVEDKVQYVLASYMLSSEFCYDYYTKRSKRYSCYIDGSLRTVSVRRILDFLTCHEEEFNELKDKKILYGMKIENFVYLVVDFVEKNNIFTTYYFEPEIIERYNKLKNYEYVDYQSVNKLSTINNLMNMEQDKSKHSLLSNKYIDNKNLVFGKNVAGDKISGKYSVNPRLIRRVLDGMDPSYDATEKAIYVYIRLCDLLSYDETNALINDGLIKENLDYDRIDRITPYDNKVVSSEFVLIYSRFLKDMGLLYQPHIECTAGYESNYSYLTFRQGEFLVKVDLFNKNIINSDLSNVKIGRTIDGIRCLNSNKTTKDKFREKVISIYAEYRRKYQKHLLMDDIIRDNIEFSEDLSIEDRILSFYDYFKESKLTGMELINYVQTLIDSTLSNGESVEYMIYKNRFGEYSLIICCDEQNFIIGLGDIFTMSILTHDDLTELISDEYGEIGYYSNPVKNR